MYTLIKKICTVNASIITQFSQFSKKDKRLTFTPMGKKLYFVIPKQNNKPSVLKS